MSCDATRQGDEMYCSRCKLRWDVATGQVVACLPVLLRTPRRTVTVAPVDSQFDARALVSEMRGTVTSAFMLRRLEAVARAAYALGKKSGPAPAIGAWRVSLKRYHFISMDRDYMKRVYGNDPDFDLRDIPVSELALMAATEASR